MDLASAYVLHPLNCLVLDFVAWNRGFGERAEVWRYTRPEMLERTLRVRGGVKDVKFNQDEVANELELRGLT